MQAAEIVDLKAQNHALQGQVVEAQRAAKTLERRPTIIKYLEQVEDKLLQERKMRRAAERQIDTLKKERTKLRRMVTLAERASRRRRLRCRSRRRGGGETEERRGEGTLA